MTDLDLIFKTIEDGHCLPFLGAGASMAYTQDGQEVSGLPSGGSLAEKLAKICDYKNGTYYDLSRVAEYFIYKNNGNRAALNSVLQKEISRVNQPRPIHTTLAQLNQIRIIITSNYDTLLETELHRYSRIMEKHFYDANNPITAHFEGKIEWEAGEVILHKMHGCIEKPSSMVITQSDYIHYLSALSG